MTVRACQMMVEDADSMAVGIDGALVGVSVGHLIESVCAVSQESVELAKYSLDGVRI